MIAPVVKLEAALARCSASGATSPGSPGTAGDAGTSPAPGAAGSAALRPDPGAEIRFPPAFTAATSSAILLPQKENCIIETCCDPRVSSTRGRLAPGLLADIIGVPGDPLEDITVTQRVKFVMKGGTVFDR
jgi:hypothetical protein